MPRHAVFRLISADPCCSGCRAGGLGLKRYRRPKEANPRPKASSAQSGPGEASGSGRRARRENDQEAKEGVVHEREAKRRRKDEPERERRRETYSQPPFAEPQASGVEVDSKKVQDLMEWLANNGGDHLTAAQTA